MNKKSFILSSGGLKNIVFNSINDNDLFTFKFGSKQIEVHQFFAEFISPYVCHLHQSDPTVNSIDIKFFKENEDRNQEFFTEEILKKLKKLIEGEEIELDEQTSKEFRMISIFLYNQEILDKMDELYPIDLKKTNIKSLIEYLKYLEQINRTNFDTFKLRNEEESLIDIISSQFESNENEFLNLSKRTLYSIISNENLKIKNHDSLFEFINRLFEKEKEEEKCSYSKIDFYEFIDIESLNEENKKKFFDYIDYDMINHEIWNKLKTFIFPLMSSNPIKQNSINNSNVKNIEFDSNPNNLFKGIVSYLLAKGITINVTASSICSGNPENVINFSNKNESFNTQSNPNSWVLYDFKERKIKPSHYTIMSDHWNSSSPGKRRPQSWVIEGSNDQQAWTELDAHLNDKSLDSQSVKKTFNITNNNNKEYFKYLRIRQTSKNTGGDDEFRFSSLEYFGSILEQ